MFDNPVSSCTNRALKFLGSLLNDFLQSAVYGRYMALEQFRNRFDAPTLAGECLHLERAAHTALLLLVHDINTANCRLTLDSIDADFEFFSNLLDAQFFLVKELDDGIVHCLLGFALLCRFPDFSMVADTVIRNDLVVNQNAKHLAVSSGAGNRVQNPVMGLTAPIHLLLESADAQILELFFCQTKSLSDGLILERMLHPADDFCHFLVRKWLRKGRVNKLCLFQRRSLVIIACCR